MFRRVFFLFLVALVLPFSFVAYGADPIGKVILLKGDCHVIREGETPQKAKLDMDVFLKDKFVTKEDSTLRIALKDGSALSLGPNAELSMDAFSFDPEQKKRNAGLKVLSGKLRAVVNDLHDYKERDFNVNTPTAIVGVRGTIFIVWVKAPKITEVFSIDKTVFVANVVDPTKGVLLKQMQGTQVTDTKPPAPPKSISETELKNIQKDIDVPPAKEEKKEEPTTTTTTAPETKGAEVAPPTTQPAPPSEGVVPGVSTTLPPSTIATTMVTTLPTTTTTTSTTSTTTTSTTTTTTTTTTSTTTTAPTTTTTTTTAPTTTTTSTTTTTTSTTTTTTTTTSSTTMPTHLPGPPTHP